MNDMKKIWNYALMAAMVCGFASKIGGAST